MYLVLIRSFLPNLVSRKEFIKFSILYNNRIFINVRQLIRRILREETEKDLTSVIKKLLNDSVLNEYRGWICGFDVIQPRKREPIGSLESFTDYQIIVYVMGGVGSLNWPNTQHVNRKRDEIVDKVWKSIYNFLGLSTDVFLKNVKTCDEVISESTVISEEKVPATPNELIKSLPEELKKLLFKQWNAKQNPKWHPEGNSLKHILVVIKRAYRHYSDDPNMIMAALFHDLGKMDTYAINPKTGQPTAYGHEYKSTDYVEQFKDWISTFDGTDVDEIKYLVKNHMKINPRTWDSMRDIKKEPISSHPAFDKLKGFTDKLDGGGYKLDKQEETEGVGAYAAPAFEMKPDHEHFKHQYNESELTERCWKGYTQKGMKTMFGKRYPNCVKVKNKK